MLRNTYLSASNDSSVNNLPATIQERPMLSQLSDEAEMEAAQSIDNKKISTKPIPETITKILESIFDSIDQIIADDGTNDIIDLNEGNAKRN